MSPFAASPTAAAHGEAPQTPTASNDAVVLLEGVKNISVHDTGSDEHQPHPSGGYHNHRHSEAHTPPFVRQGANIHYDGDVFSLSPKPKGSSEGDAPTKNTSKKHAMKHSLWRSGSMGSVDSNSGSDRSAPATSSPQSGNGSYRLQQVISPSGLRYDNVVESEDPQAIYHPAFCVFVANLLQSETEEALEVAVTKVFREYGSVFVKIRRDDKHMPFAFCQYTNAEDAARAIEEGRGRLIKGRPCRCEKAKCHRSFHVERKYGPTITPEEAAGLLRRFGPIDVCRPVNHTERATMDLNDGVVVEFTMFDAGKAAVAFFRNHDKYKVQSLYGMGSPGRGNSSRTDPPDNENRAYLQRYDMDRRSIFVGNLPLNTTETHLRELFEQYGNIQSVIIREAASKFEASDKFVFAFIEFGSASSVSQAIKSKHGCEFGEKTLRVAQKDSDNAKNRSIRTPSGTSITVSSHHSTTTATAQQPVSPPMTQMPSPGYGSPYAYPYGSPVYQGYQNSSWFSDSQGQYYVVPYSPYSLYAGSPTYNSGFSAAVSGSLSPSSQQPYNYGYYPYGHTSPYHVPPAPVYHQGQAQQSPDPYFTPSYSPTTVGTNVAEDRAATPTPAGHSEDANSSMESE